MANIEENQDITDNEDIINDNETVSADTIADNSGDIPADDNNVEINGEDDSQESKFIILRLHSTLISQVPFYYITLQI